MAGGHVHGVVTSTGLDVALAGVNGEGVVSIIAGQLEGCISILFGRIRGEVFKTFDAVAHAIGERFTLPVESTFLMIEADFASNFANAVNECVVSGAIYLACIEIARIVGILTMLSLILGIVLPSARDFSTIARSFLQKLGGVVGSYCSE